MEVMSRPMLTVKGSWEIWDDASCRQAAWEAVQALQEGRVDGIPPMLRDRINRLVLVMGRSRYPAIQCRAELWLRGFEDYLAGLDMMGEHAVAARERMEGGIGRFCAAARLGPVRVGSQDDEQPDKSAAGAES